MLTYYSADAAEIMAITAKKTPDSEKYAMKRLLSRIKAYFSITLKNSS